MSYSRRQLYALGEPLGECVTRKEGGRIVYGGGGGGSSNVQQSTTVSDLPDWAKPTAQKTLARGEALTDISANPYQTYGGQRLAGFQPLQEQAFSNVGAMQPSAAGQQAQGIAGLASLGALGAGYNPYQTGQFNQQASDYMSPFIQNALAPQLREMGRQSDIQRNAEQARAVGQGAFGGSRSAIVEAERQRNLGMQQQDVLDRGYQQAFDRAQQQFNTEQQLREQSRQYGAGYGMQGLQTALQGASQLGNLGAQQFGQQKDIIGLQSQMGAQQQAQQQAGLTQNYQDFLNQQKYPYQQLEFMSNLLRGTPMGTVNTMYTPGPTGLQTIGSLGMGAYGLSQLTKADGGTVSSYAGGGSVTDEEFVATAVQRLSDQQLQQELKDAQAEGDAAKFKLVQTELSRRAQMRSGADSTGNQSGGLGALFSAEMADKVLPTQESMARGGIVAFADGDVVEDDTTDDEEDKSPAGAGDPNAFNQYNQRLLNVASRLEGYTPKNMTPAQYQAAYKQALGEQERVAGASPYNALREEIAGFSTERENNLAQGRGLAALQAAAAMMQGRGAVQGLARAGSAFGQSYSQALQADRLEKKSLTSMKINLADAERKERMGMHEAAVRSADKARADYAAAQKGALTRDTALASIYAKGAAATKPPKPGAGPKVPEQLAAARLEYAKNPTPENRAIVDALSQTARETRTTFSTSDVGPVRADIMGRGQDVTTRGQDVAAFTKAEAAIQKQITLAPKKFKDYATKFHNGDEAAARLALIRENMQGMESVLAGMGRGTPTPAAAPAARPASSVNTNSPRPAGNVLRFDAQGNAIP